MLFTVYILDWGYHVYWKGVYMMCDVIVYIYIYMISYDLPTKTPTDPWNIPVWPSTTCLWFGNLFIFVIWGSWDLFHGSVSICLRIDPRSNWGLFLLPVKKKREIGSVSLCWSWSMSTFGWLRGLLVSSGNQWKGGKSWIVVISESINLGKLQRPINRWSVGHLNLVVEKSKRNPPPKILSKFRLRNDFVICPDTSTWFAYCPSARKGTKGTKTIKRQTTKYIWYVYIHFHCDQAFCFILEIETWAVTKTLVIPWVYGNEIFPVGIQSLTNQDFMECRQGFSSRSSHEPRKRTWTYFP